MRGEKEITEFAVEDWIKNENIDMADVHGY
jgi:hypothetical protein